MISGKTILITGGTGSFGRCMVEHLLNEHDPARVIVYSRGEEKQVAMQRDLPISGKLPSLPSGCKSGRLQLQRGEDAVYIMIFEQIDVIQNDAGLLHGLVC